MTKILGIHIPSKNSQLFTVNASFTVPVGITQLLITACGGGGAGGGCSKSISRRGFLMKTKLGAQ